MTAPLAALLPPSPTAHSIGWTIWHIRMNRMEDEAAAAMRMPPKEELLGYVREVFAATDAEVEKIDEADSGRRSRAAS